MKRLVLILGLAAAATQNAELQARLAAIEKAVAPGAAAQVKQP